MTAETGGGFVTSPDPTSSSSSGFIPSTPASTTTTLASPPLPRLSHRPISSREESRLISQLDEQITTISSRFTRRNNEGGYTSLKRLAKDYHHLLQTLLSHSPPAKAFMITQYLIRMVGDLNEQLPSLAVPDDPRGIFYVLKQVDDAIVHTLQHGAMSQTEKVRLRNELERGRGAVAETFEEYKGGYQVEEAIGRVYERSLEEMEEPFGVGGSGQRVLEDFDDEEGEKLQEDILDDVDLH